MSGVWRAAEQASAGQYGEPGQHRRLTPIATPARLTPFSALGLYSAPN